jgi:hypothetical protein
VFYAGQAHPIPGGTIRTGETVRLVLDKGERATDWLKKNSKLDDLLKRVPALAERRGQPKAAGPQAGPAATTPGDTSLQLLGMLFHEASLPFTEGVFPSNASLRRLDQSWRLSPENRGEVILVGRVALPARAARETLDGANSPSRLWLKGLPGSGAAREPIPGTGQQETWVRVYLPVR